MNKLESWLVRCTEKVPGVCGGQRVLKGTRLCLDVIVGRVRAGDSIESVAEDYRHLNQDQLNLIKYCARLKIDLTPYI